MFDNCTLFSGTKLQNKLYNLHKGSESYPLIFDETEEYSVDVC